MRATRSDKGIKKDRNQNCSFCGRSNLAILAIHLRSCKHRDNLKYDPSYSERKVASQRGVAGRVWTEAQKAAHSLAMQKAVRENPNSYRGRFFRGYSPVVQDGVSYDSAWEFRLKQYLDSEQITYIRMTEGFPYTYKGVKRTYFPDFFLPKLKLYVEVKGLATTRDLAKWRAFKHKLVIVSGQVIRHILNGGRFDFGAAAKHESQFVVGNRALSRRQLLSMKVSQFDGLSLRPKKTEKEKHLNRSNAQKARWASAEARAKRVSRLAENASLLDPRYSGSRNSQSGSFWITNGTVNKKWRDLLGKIPRGFKRGRSTK